MPPERGVSADEEPLLAVQCSLPLHFCEKCFPRRCFLIYREALSYIESIGRVGSDYGVERMRVFLDILGEPDKRLKFIHVAGTNGKGSVSAYLTSVLREAGYRVGTYNSPSVFCYNERWCLDGRSLCDADVAKYMTALRQAIEQENARRGQLGLLKFDGANPVFTGEFQPTAFEIETALAMLAFKDKDCDIVVLETGLGGRFDATNAIRQKELAVITPIGLDHCALLGNTLGEIAAEKAAIIRGGAVTCAQSAEVMQSILNPYEIVDGVKKALPANVEICKEAKLIKGDIGGQLFEYGGKKYRIALLGGHQLQNASIAICAIEYLIKNGWKISEAALEAGLANARWSARLEIVKDAENRFNIYIPDGKTLVFDGAHNPHGATALAAGLKEYFENKRIHLVLGMLADKDVDGAVGILAPLARRVTAVTPDSPRALDKEVLYKKVAAYTSCDICEDIRLAVQNALSGDCDVVVLCGSLTLFKSLTDN